MLKKHGRCSDCCLMILVLLVPLAGCASHGSQPTVDLIRLQLQLVAEYGGSNVVVALQDAHTLSVTIAGDASTDPASDRGLERAQEIAKFVCKRYGSMGEIDIIRVGFLIRQNGSGVDASAQLAYAFALTELACGGR